MTLFLNFSNIQKLGFNQHRKKLLFYNIIFKYCYDVGTTKFSSKSIKYTGFFYVGMFWKVVHHECKKVWAQYYRHEKMRHRIFMIIKEKNREQNVKKLYFLIGFWTGTYFFQDFRDRYMQIKASTTCFDSV